MLRAKQLKLSLEELEELEEGDIYDLMIEAGNDQHGDEYKQVATQADFDKF